MQLHIEMKGPAICKEAIANYDYRLATEMTRDLIDHYKLWDRAMVTSFDPLIIRNIEIARKQRHVVNDFKICHIVNRFGLDSIIGYQSPKKLQGIMMNDNYLKPEYIEKNHAEDKLIGVWYSKD